MSVWSARSSTIFRSPRPAPAGMSLSNTRGLLDPGVLYLGYAEHGGPWMFFDADGRVPSKYWLIDPRTGQVLKSGERPPNYVPIEFDRYEPFDPHLRGNHTGLGEAARRRAE